MDGEKKFIIGIILATVALIGGAVFFLGKGSVGSSVTQTVSRELVEKSDAHFSGPVNPKVVVVEFSDFQCPACKAAEPLVKSIREKYKDKIKFVYRYYPLPSHQYAWPSAQAAETAGLQGKFWEMHDLLFSKQPQFEEAKLKIYGQSLGLDMEKFNKDFGSDEVRQRIISDQADGNKANVEATPTFFINGTKFTGLPADFEKEISSRL